MITGDGSDGTDKVLAAASASAIAADEDLSGNADEPVARAAPQPPPARATPVRASGAATAHARYTASDEYPVDGPRSAVASRELFVPEIPGSSRETWSLTGELGLDDLEPDERAPFQQLLKEPQPAKPEANVDVARGRWLTRASIVTGIGIVLLVTTLLGRGSHSTSPATQPPSAAAATAAKAHRSHHRKLEAGRPRRTPRHRRRHTIGHRAGRRPLPVAPPARTGRVAEPPVRLASAPVKSRPATVPTTAWRPPASASSEFGSEFTP